MASAIFFGTVAFAAVALMTHVSVHGNGRLLLQAARNPRSSALDMKSFQSIYCLLHHTTVFGMILLYAYITEFHPPYPHSPKSYDRDQFFFITGLLFIVASFTWTKNDSKNDERIETPRNSVQPSQEASEVLNRFQTEEWKGWMQFMFLLYHYYHAEEVYNAIRVMITCYVWMTGFGNFSFFYVKGDYGAVRVLQMLWRLNFLVLFLCLTQGTTYILYYICLLHTYFFLMVYVTMRIGKRYNYLKWTIRIKLMVLAVAIFVIWDLDIGLFRVIHWPFLGQYPQIGATSGALYEWYFRSSLDHWSTFFGMVFALNFPITSLFYRKLEGEPLWREITGKGLVAIAMGLALYLWVTGPFQQSKFDYNQTNAYYAVIPLYVYIFFRNLTPWLRGHHFHLLHEIGKTTLETYLMQHHIWLTSDAKSLLTLLPGWPKVNFLLTTIIYFQVSRRLYQLTLYLRGMILPNDLHSCLRNLLAVTAALTCSFAVALLLRVAGVLDLWIVGVISVFLGYALYQATVSISWEAYAADNGIRPSRNVSVAPSVVTGTVAVLAIGILWSHMQQSGASKIQRLESHCAPFVNNGAWIPVDSCSEVARGVGYRDHNIFSYGTCSSEEGNALVWGWKTPRPSSHCRFTRRDSKTALGVLKHRNVTFVGDSIVRFMYHSFRAQLGDKHAVAVNTSLPSKWQDYSHQYGNTYLEFRWAPFAEDSLMYAKRLEAEDSKADVVIMGVGLWDRLRHNETHELESTYRTAAELARTMQRLREDGLPVVWLTPTTVNTWALPTPEKRMNIREDQVEIVRSKYREAGVEAAVSFVLSGEAFTQDRVDASFDGVHYHPRVYDAGSQILLNALDWILPSKELPDDFEAPLIGQMSHPELGLVILLFIFVGLFLFDGFMGFTYLAAITNPSLRPSQLYFEAFASVHRQHNLPALMSIHSSKSKTSPVPRSMMKSHLSDREQTMSSDEEFVAMLDQISETCVNGVEMQVI